MSYINSAEVTEVTLSIGCQINLGFNLPNILDLKISYKKKVALHFVNGSYFSKDYISSELCRVLALFDTIKLSPTQTSVIQQIIKSFLKNHYYPFFVTPKLLLVQ